MKDKAFGYITVLMMGCPTHMPVKSLDYSENGFEKTKSFKEIIEDRREL